MRALAWQQYLDAQRRLHDKTVFTVTELANVSGSSPHVLNVQLDRLIKQGVIVRHARGCYGLPDAADVHTLLPCLDVGAYATACYALYRHNLVTQVPAEIICFSNRRQNRSRLRTTAAGRFCFMCIRPPIYAPPAQGILAPPEQALCDFVFVSRRRGLSAESLVTFTGLHRLDRTVLADVLARYPRTVAHEVAIISSRAGLH